MHLQVCLGSVYRCYSEGHVRSDASAAISLHFNDASELQSLIKTIFKVFYIHKYLTAEEKRKDDSQKTLFPSELDCDVML